MTEATHLLATDPEEIRRQYQRGLALVHADVLGLTQDLVLEMYGIAQETVTDAHIDRHNIVRAEVPEGGEVPPVILRPRGESQARFDAIGMQLGRTLSPITREEPVSVEDGYFLWYLQAGDELLEHCDDSSGYGLRLAAPMGGTALFGAANHKPALLHSPSAIVQNLSSPILHGARNLTAGRMVPIWDLETVVS